MNKAEINSIKANNLKRLVIDDLVIDLEDEVE